MKCDADETVYEVQDVTDVSALPSQPNISPSLGKAYADTIALAAAATSGLTGGEFVLVSNGTSGSFWVFEPVTAEAGDVTPHDNPSARWRQTLGMNP